MARGAVVPGEASTSQQLASVIKSARDIMRKDKGLSGDLDRLPMLTWIMFLKFLDDMEQVREAEAALEGKPFSPAIEPPYRWRDWAANPAAITGEELIAFVNQDEAVRPDGIRGLGLFAYLRSLQGRDGGDRRDVIANVFRGTVNRMINGYLLRDVINKVNGVNFRSSDETHTLSMLYESMLKEMRDAAGDAGEFYTPRPVVRFIVTVIDPRLGETILDPAAGTGGFLVSAFEHLEEQCNKVEDREQLQRGTLFGIEAKPLPYLLCQMNLLLHGLEYPEIDYDNALRTPLREIGDKDRVDVVMTNPPFGGEEERGILGNFPEDKQTSETALLFLQLIMRKLRRPATTSRGGRCGMVVSDGFLSTKGVAARIKAQLLSELNLHTVVRLPKGVFVPYTPIATNLLFFDRSKATDKIWYWEVPGPTGRKTYSKTRPFVYEEFAECLAWWHDRKPGKHAWLVDRPDIESRGFDLDIKNPAATVDFQHFPACELALRALNGFRQSVKQAEELVDCVSEQDATCALRPLGHCIRLRKEFTTIRDDAHYKLVRVQLHARGIVPRETKLGAQIRVKRQQVLRGGELLVAEIDAKVGGCGIVPPELEGAIVSSHYFVYELDEEMVDCRYLEWFLRSGIPEAAIQPYVKGSTNYAAIRQNHFPLLKMPLPPLAEQRRIAAYLDDLHARVEALTGLQEETAAELDAMLPSILNKAFKGEL
jgi:type I restriction enzyme M protein